MSMLSSHDDDLPVLVSRTGEAKTLASPTVGLWYPPEAAEVLLSPGASLGWVETLERKYRLVAPDALNGLFRATNPTENRCIAVQYGQTLGQLVSVVAGQDDAASVAPQEQVRDELVFRSPSAGRFYDRPSPDAPPFVKPGDPLQPGTTLGLLEIMKTFNRLVYEDAQLPPTARVRKVLVASGAVVSAGQALIELEAG